MADEIFERTPTPDGDEEAPLDEQLRDVDEQISLTEGDLSSAWIEDFPAERARLEEKLRRLRRLRKKIAARAATPAAVTTPAPAQAPPPAAAAPPPPAAAPPGPTVAIEAGGGSPNALYGNVPFAVVATVPRTGTPEPTLTVHFHAPAGDRDLTLAWDGGVKGPVRYRSEPITLDAGAEGGGKLSFEMPIHAPGRIATGEIRTGGMSGLSIGNGDDVTVSVGSGAVKTAVTLPAYQTVRDHAIAVNAEFFAGLHKEVVEALIKLKPFGALPAAAQVREILTQKLHLLEHARITMGDPRNDGPVEQLAWGNAYVRLLRQPGLVDRMEEDREEQRAIREIRDKYAGVMDTFVKDFGIGFYQFVMSQIPLSGSVWTVVMGTDILGNKVEGWERVAAALDVAGQAAMIGLPVAIQQEHAVSGTTARIAREPAAPRSQPVENVLRAPAGTFVKDINEVGFTQETAWEINKRATLLAQKEVAEAIAEGRPPQFQEAHVAVRPLDRATLKRVTEEGLATKPEPVKPKSVNKTDIEAGYARPGDEKLIAYYTPEQILEPLGIDPASLDLKHLRAGEPAPKAGIKPEVWDRAVQRINEHFNEAADMAKYEAMGLLAVDEHGLIIDHGISEYRLDEHHQLTPINEGGARAVKPGPMTGDPDLWWFTDEKGDPLPAWARDQLVRDLEHAGIKHPDVLSWDIEHDPHYSPAEQKKNIGIRDKIAEAHAGRIDEATGVIVPATGKATAVVWFRGWFKPRATGYGKFRSPVMRPVRIGRLTVPLAVPVVSAGLVAAGVGLGFALAGGGSKSSSAAAPASTGAGARPAAAATSTPAPAAAAPLFGLGLTNATVELSFSARRFTRCAPALRPQVAPTFSGGWKLATSPPATGKPTNVNLAPLPTSPFGDFLNGTIGSNGLLLASGNSTYDALSLRLMLPARVSSGHFAGNAPVAGTALVTSHFRGGANCVQSWRVSGKLAPP